MWREHPRTPKAQARCLKAPMLLFFPRLAVTGRVARHSPQPSVSSKILDIGVRCDVAQRHLGGVERKGKVILARCRWARLHVRATAVARGSKPSSSAAAGQGLYVTAAPYRRMSCLSTHAQAASHKGIHPSGICSPPTLLHLHLKVAAHQVHVEGTISRAPVKPILPVCSKISKRHALRSSVLSPILECGTAFSR